MSSRLRHVFLAGLALLTFTPANASTPFAFFFASGSASIDAESAAVLDHAAAAYRDFDVRLFVMWAHADRVGANEANYRLSLRRAEAIRAALVSRGVLASRIEVKAVGESQPLIPTDDGVGEPRNRVVLLWPRDMCNPPPMRSKSDVC